MFMMALVSGTAFTQCLPDTSYARPGIYPDTATGLPPAFATYLYKTVVTAVIPVDTLIFGARYPVDSIGVLEVTGFLPDLPSPPIPLQVSGKEENAAVC